MKSKVRFISGISSGLGKAIAEAVINKGDFVIGTFRKQSQTDHFNRKYSQHALGLTIDALEYPRNAIVL